MPFFHPELHPPSGGHTAATKSVIITGGNSGIGLSTTRELLCRGTSTIVLAMRSMENGKHAESNLLSGPQIRELNPTSTISVMKINLDDYASVQTFADEANRVLPSLYLLILNAGVGNARFEQSTSGHKRTRQVDYLSNVILLLLLLPLLRKTAEQTEVDGGPCYTRVTWIGSRAHKYTSLASKPQEALMGHFNDNRNFLAIIKIC